MQKKSKNPNINQTKAKDILGKNLKSLFIGNTRMPNQKKDKMSKSARHHSSLGRVEKSSSFPLSHHSASGRVSWSSSFPPSSCVSLVLQPSALVEYPPCPPCVSHSASRRVYMSSMAPCPFLIRILELVHHLVLETLPIESKSTGFTCKTFQVQLCYAM